MDAIERVFYDAILTTHDGNDPTEALDREIKREQRRIINSAQLPLKANFSEPPDDVKFAGITDEMEYDQRREIMDKNLAEWTRVQYFKMGIKVLDPVDELMVNVELPEGWKKCYTDHGMWNEVRDEKDRKRLTYFYKGAFWDRDAFSCFVHRYSFEIVPQDEYSKEHTYQDRKRMPWILYITDCGQRIAKLKEYTPQNDQEYFNQDEMFRKLAITYLDENYPGWKDIHAYWNT